MAIIFTKSLPNHKMLMAYNNNIIRFHSDVVGTPTKATLNGFGMVDVILYPHPNGSFYFNFKEYITANLNTKNFAGEFDVDFSAPGSTFQVGREDGYFKEDVLNIKISFLEVALVDDIVSIGLDFALGVEQVTDRFTEQFDNGVRRNWLTPQRPDGKHYVKFWRGYQFDVSYYLGFTFPIAVSDLVSVVNSENAPDFFTLMPLTFENTQRVNSLYLSDGTNYLLPTMQRIIEIGNLVIEQVDGACGIYVKFRNKYGKWNYWLFEGNPFNSRSTKSLGELNNDFNDVSETISPMVQLGRTADSTIKVQGDRLYEQDKLVLEEIIDSPKIYLYTGQPNDIPDERHWLEVSLKTNSFITQTPKKKVYKYTIEFDLPLRYTQTL